MDTRSIPSPGQRNGVWRVVIADDEPEFRAWLKSLLDQSDDFELVGEAATGEQAVRLIPRLVPDLLIADMYMPEPDGLEVARCVQEKFPATKAILVSAHAERVYQRLAREAGALTFIPKVAFSLDAVREALRAER